jgi:hypothetical protein
VIGGSNMERVPGDRTESSFWISCHADLRSFSCSSAKRASCGPPNRSSRALCITTSSVSGSPSA